MRRRRLFEMTPAQFAELERDQLALDERRWNARQEKAPENRDAPKYDEREDVF